jgi:hypothetical protein
MKMPVVANRASIHDPLLFSRQELGVIEEVFMRPYLITARDRDTVEKMTTRGTFPNASEAKHGS